MTLKRAIRKIAETTRNFIGNKITNKFTSTASRINLETALQIDEKLKELRKKKYTPPETSYW